MDPDRLRTLLGILKDAGVTHYEDDVVTVHLGAPQPAPGPMQSAPSPEDVAAAQRRVMYGPIR